MQLLGRVDYSKFNQAVTYLSQTLKVDFATALREQGKLLAQDLMKVSFPRKSSDGVKAVKGDIRRAVIPAWDKAKTKVGEAVRFTNPKVLEIIRRKDYNAMRVFLSRTLKFKDWNVEPFDPVTQHLNKRDAYGHVRKSQKVMTLDYRKYKAYVNAMVKRVGHMKAGWGKVFHMLGGIAVPRWVSRHLSYARGKMLDNTQASNPNIEISNQTKGITRYRSTYQFALNLRAKKIYAHIKHVLRARAKQAQAI